MTSSKERKACCVASLDDGEFDEAMERVLQQDGTADDLIVCGDVTLVVTELCECLLVHCGYGWCQCMHNRVESPDLKSDRSCDQNSQSSGQKSSNKNEHHFVHRVLCASVH